MGDIKKKKILMTLMRLEIGGAETHVLELSLELARRGFQVVVASGGGVYEKYLEKAGIRHYTVPMYTKSPQKVLRSVCLLKKIIRDEQIDIVHAHGRIPAFLCGLLHPFMHFTFVTTAHWVFRTDKGLKYISNWGEKVMAVSEDIKTYLIQNYGTDPKNIYVTINGIDTERFSPKADFSAALQEFSLPKDSQKIVYISRMDEDRALVAFHLAEIAPEIEKAHPGTDIVIVGGGNVFDKLQQLTEQINHQVGRRMITLTGARTDIDQFAAMADLFIGVSRSALEAMACAKPVIVAGNEGYLGIFDESKLASGIETNFCCRGLAASSKDLLLRDVLTVMSADDAQTEHWGAYCRQIICEHYSVAKMAADNAKMYCDALDTKAWDAVISGYYGYGNSGDEALLSAMVSHLREIKPDIRLCVLSKNPSETEAAYHVASIHRYHYHKIKKAIRSAKLFISGGGSLLQDVTSNRSLSYYIMLLKTAQKAGTPFMLYANGIGPITHANNQQAVRKVLQHAAAITLREEASFRELKRLGVPESKIRVTADPALTIESADSAAIDKLLCEEKIDAGERLFGISVRPWKTCGADYNRRLAEVIDAVCRRHQLVPVFIPMKYPEDYDVSAAIARLLQTKGYVLQKPRTASELIGLIGRTKLMLAERLHCLIYAADALVPTVGLSYDVKIDAFIEYISAGVVADVTDFSPQAVETAAEQVLANYDIMKQKLEERSAVLRKKAKENAEIACDLIRASEDSYEIDGN